MSFFVFMLAIIVGMAFYISYDMEQRYGTSADWAFWLECTKNGEAFELVPLTLSMYFFNDASHNRVNDVAGEKELRIINDYIDSEQKNFIQQ